MSTQLQNKFSNFQPQPPEGIWNKIADALDGDTDHSFAEKMLYYQATPPVQMWDKIVTELDKDQAAVVPIRKKFPTLFKYAAAVILLAGIIGIGIVINNRSVSNEQADGRQPFNTATPSFKNTPDAEEKNLAKEMQQTSDNLQVADKKRRRAPAIPLSSLDLGATSFAFESKNATIKVDKKPSIRHELIDRYILFSKTTGDAVKLSKKLFSLFACSDEEENCKKSIEAAQRKMAAPTMMASADFTGVLEALQTINNQ